MINISFLIQFLLQFDLNVESMYIIYLFEKWLYTFKQYFHNQLLNLKEQLVLIYSKDKHY